MTLEDIFGTVLEVPPAELRDDSSRDEISNWTSLAHITLVTALEEAYGVTFRTDEIPTIQTVGTARRLLRAKGIAV
jgi:acyl carrier protein